MLALEYRPRTFSQMAGQEMVKKVLMHISADPENAPQTILLCGAFGSGKTTAARIFARALNCPHKLPNGDACGECDFCKSEIQDSMFYSEYDSAIVGNVSGIKELRNTFYFGYTKGYKVIVFDEVHLVSRQAQGALLKVLEEPEPNVFYVLCTTDPDKLLPTITSRSLELRYDTVSPKDMIPFLKSVLESKNIEITKEVENNLSLIAVKSRGHMRNAMMLLDNMILLKDDFKDIVKTSRLYFLQFLVMSLKYNFLISKGKTEEQINEGICNILNELNMFDPAVLKHDYSQLVKDIAVAVFIHKSDDKAILDLCEPYKDNFNFINLLNDPLVYESFSSSATFPVAMLSLYCRLKKFRG